MSFLDRFWRVPALALAVALPLAVACADDEGAVLEQDTEETGSISGTVTNSETGEPIVGALVGTSPATTTSLTDASGNFTISNVATGSYAVTASKEGFESNSTTVSVSEGATATANIPLDPITVDVPTTGDLNVKVVRRNGDPVEGATVEVLDSEGAAVVDAVETNAEGFALFDGLDPQSVTVRATKDISGFPFRASAGTNIEAGEVAFVELTLRRDHQQSTFPNIDGESVELGPGSDIEFVPAPGGDSNPEVDCNIIRTQHMFIAEVTNEEGTPVSGVKVQWDLNISENGTVTIECNDNLAELLGQEAGCGVTTVPGNTGSVVDSDDPDLDPGTARSFNVTTRKAVTFTNDNDQDVSFNGETVTVGAGQTWIVITSPVEGQTDVIAATPDIPAAADCANNSPGACDKEFAIKRWVNWDIRVAELEWPAAEAGVRDEDNPGQTDDDCDGNSLGGEDDPACDPHDDPRADFTFVSDGGTITNVLARVETRCDLSDFDGDGDTHGEGDFGGQPFEGACELTQNRVLFISEVERLRPDSPFNMADGFMVWDVVDNDRPDVDFWGEG
ncbi:MAG: carboxypeptidase-like regulatory domain-containing protein, partial [Gemmatimonadota bacterium]|nr:carboxypeptidase-like regulatory domain-containing protein [Gemmatimonadota bacterium]